MRRFVVLGGLVLVVAGLAVGGGLSRSAAAGTPGAIVFSSTFAGNREIFSASSDGLNRIDLTRDPHADITPSWSADGRRIAFASDRSGSMEIYLMNADGSGVAQVTHDRSYDDDPRLTPDGQTVVYESKRGGNWEIRRIGIDGSREVDLTRNRASDRFPALSPNGRTVAFASSRGTSGVHVWAMRLQGSGVRRVTSGSGGQSQPAWAPSGGRLAYVVGTAGRLHAIWSVLASGRGLRRLTPPGAGDALDPAWSPDGRSIVYQRCPGGGLAGCGLSTLALGGQPVDISSLRAPFVDAFDGGSGQFWRSWSSGSGATIDEQNGRLEATVAADSVQGGQYDQISVESGTTCRLAGDFDVQVDYQLLEWPAANGVQVVLQSFDAANQGVVMARESETGLEQYVSWIPPSSISAPTGDLSGTLRLQREGSTMVTSYLHGGAWVPLASGPTSTTPAMLALGVSSFLHRFGHQEVKVAWDNFHINSGAITCPTVWWEDDSPAWQAVTG
jgi:dipeptidyl aminopeptidase/acylaminoacyl peptidase